MYRFDYSRPWKELGFFFLVQLFLAAPCPSQQAPPVPSQQVLIFLRDSARVDYLNRLSYYYLTAEKKDSALYYALLAQREAEALNYLHGVAISLSRQSQIAKHFDDDFIKSEQLGKAALQWFERSSDKSGMDTLYSHLTYTVFAQSRFDEALEYARRIYVLARQTNDRANMFSALMWMFSIYRQSGEYEKSFNYVQQLHNMAIKANNKVWISSTLYALAQLYMLIEDYPHALYYFREVLRIDNDETRRARIIGDVNIWFKMEFTEVFAGLHQFDSAWHYYRLYKPENDKEVYMRVYWVSTGECHLLQKEFTRALQSFQLGLAAHQKLHDRNEVMRTLLDLGKTYLALNDNVRALTYGQQGLNIALQTKAKQFIRDGYQILSVVYDRLHQRDSANYYFRQYALAKEGVANDQTKGRLAAYKYEQQIALVNTEKELQQVRLQKATFVKRVLLSATVILLLLGFILFRNLALKRRAEKQQLEHEITLQKLESERAQAELQQRTTELQMQALRAQMNPHFIFNSLNSINHFILQNEKAQASGYLIKFARLVRLILQHSQLPFISLESELETLKLYLELEALRFNHHFSYTITVEESLDISALQVPPLIFQPYIENAIWHGLMNKEERGHLELHLYQQDEFLCCRITDDGVGRKKAAELKSRSSSTYRSVGLQITANRIAMLHANDRFESHVHITDLVSAGGEAAGTEVTLKLPVRYA